MSTLTLDRDEVVRLAALATGDEKHEESSDSTLDALLVLYDRVLHVDPADPDGPARPLHPEQGPRSSRLLCRARLARLLPRALACHLHPAGQPPRQPSRPPQVPGVEASTGSLGHGLALAVGVALALRAKGSTDQRVVVLTGDAELNEGSNWESIMLAPQLRLGNLTLLVIDNHSSVDPMAAVARAPGVVRLGRRVVDGHDHDALEPRSAPATTCRPPSSRP